MSLQDGTTLTLTTEIRLVTCPTCAMVHAVPADLHLVASRDQRAIYCPAGHEWTPLAPDAQAVSNTVAMILETRSKMAQVRVENELLRRRLAELTPTGKAELKRRSFVLAENAPPGRGPETAMCPYCGRSKRRGRLAEHLRRQHGDEIEKGGEVLARAEREGGGDL